MMLENPKQIEGIESEHNVGELEKKIRDRIRARCWRTWNKKKGSNPSMMPENPKQKKGSNVSKGAKKGLCPSLRHQYNVRNPPLHKVKVTKLEILQTFILEEKPSSLIHNIQYPPTTDRGYAAVCTFETQISR